MENSMLYFVHCMSPVHIGAGQGTGLIDMPMLREKTTEWPYMPGSSIKGVHRRYFESGKSKISEEWVEEKVKEWVNHAFGQEEKNNEKQKETVEKSGSVAVDKGNSENAKSSQATAGALVMSDARLLAFPVASLHGTFAYVTCPLAIQRMQRDVLAIGSDMPKLVWDHLLDKLTDNVIVTDANSKIADHNMLVTIDEFNSKAEPDESFREWAEWLAEQAFLKKDPISQTMLTKRLVLVADEVFQYFVTICSEVVTRIGIDRNTGTVKDGALWTEEYLPVESLLYGVVWKDYFSRSAKGIASDQVLEPFLKDQIYLQIGGNATVGKGRIRCSYAGGETE
ncbi:type III-B CRISPR module RAMP protein Cmr4 [Paenibacillus sp.]|jgi:CRISPR-associated protein Cmr4|uniref:type III-B CRISPR module RAMP protein Cmr4 n=1 Tax=Paenibacillus sp. TaxID=58172 RepID=UPI0028305BCA|nr:type III-B CRISPR module RAMP protein Cmr4 [Paenibacillus sp.]MDR0266841.1 type III-B CRISPR module RAMP protein Cmr4 [Paenibacillus sp.]